MQKRIVFGSVDVRRMKPDPKKEAEVIGGLDGIYYLPVCAECGRTFKSEHGLKIHRARCRYK